MTWLGPALYWLQVSSEHGSQARPARVSPRTGRQPGSAPRLTDTRSPGPGTWDNNKWRHLNSFVVNSCHFWGEELSKIHASRTQEWTFKKWTISITGVSFKLNLPQTVQLVAHDVYRCFAKEIDCEAILGYYSGPKWPFKINQMPNNSSSDPQNP